MVSPDDLQAALIAKVQAGTNVALVTSDIRELSYQGQVFTYPNLRVGILLLVPKGDGTCHEAHSIATWIVSAFSEQNSSQQASDLIGKVITDLFGHQLSGTGFTVSTMDLVKVQAPHLIVLPLALNEKILF